jgi:hypothetical protein
LLQKAAIGRYASIKTFKASVLAAAAKRFIGLQDTGKLEAVGDQLFGIDAVRLHGLEQRGRGDSVHESRGDPL